MNENETELFNFLATCLIDNNSSGKVLINTFNESILMSPNSVEDMDDLQPCNNEEADSCICLHLKNDASCRHTQNVIIHTADRDVVVLCNFQILGG